MTTRDQQIDNRRDAMVSWQAHRGGGAHERPDNTMVAMKYAWGLDGGIPEADIRTTSDGVIICLHDATLARTTDAPAAIADKPADQLTLEQIKKWDAGAKFDATYTGEHIPTLEQVFQTMSENKSRQVYLDLKVVDLDALGSLIEQYDLAEQVLIASPKQQQCAALRKRLPGVRTMLWIGGTPDKIEEKFDRALANGFDGLDQVQIHLYDKENGSGHGWRFQVGPELLTRALKQTKSKNIDLQVFAWQFEAADIHQLLDMGIRWFATDEPARFAQALDSWRMSVQGDNNPGESCHCEVQ